MWTHRLAAPGRLEAAEVEAPEPDSLGPGRILLRTLTGGIQVAPDNQRRPATVAVFLQSIACVLHALERVPGRERSVAVVALGPIVLLFAQVAAYLGAARVIAVYPLPRPRAAAFGLVEALPVARGP